MSTQLSLTVKKIEALLGHMAAKNSSDQESRFAAHVAHATICDANPEDPGSEVGNMKELLVSTMLKDMDWCRNATEQTLAVTARRIMEIYEMNKEKAERWVRKYINECADDEPFAPPFQNN